MVGSALSGSAGADAVAEEGVEAYRARFPRVAPDLVHYACRRYLDHALHKVRRAAAMGAAGIWIEECLTDLVSPESYTSLSLP